VEVDGKKARWDVAKGVLIDPPFGPWPRDHAHESLIELAMRNYPLEDPEDFLHTTTPGQDVTEALGFTHWRHKAKIHACCWLWKLAVIIPLLHIALHLFGIPHPEVISFIP